MFAYRADPFSYGVPRRASYYAPEPDYAYARRQRELARQAELEAAYRREMEAARAYRIHLEQEREREEHRRYLQQQQLREQQLRQRATQRQQPSFYFVPPQQPAFQLPARHRPVTRQECVPVRRHTREEQEKAASVLQRKWRTHLTERKVLAQLQTVLVELTKLKAHATFPAEPAFDANGKLLYTSVNAPIHAYVDQLEKLLIKLDAVESHGLESIKTHRRQIVQTIEVELSRVEAWKAATFERSRPAVEEGAGTGFNVPIRSGSPDGQQEPQAAVESAHSVDVPSPSAEDSATPVEASAEASNTVEAEDGRAIEIDHPESRTVDPSTSEVESSHASHAVENPSPEATFPPSTSRDIEVDEAPEAQPASLPHSSGDAADQSTSAVPVHFHSEASANGTAQEQTHQDHAGQESESDTVQSARGEFEDELNSLHSEDGEADTFVVV